MVKQFQDKPVKFLAIGAGDTLQEAAAYARETGLVMPIFADNLSVMEKRYGMKISLSNIYQFRVIGPDGKVVAYQATKDSIEKALKGAEGKYKKEDYDPKLFAALDCFENGQYAQGSRLLATLRKSKVKAVAESVDKFQKALREEAGAWKAAAEKVAEENPVEAHELYGRITTVFAGDDLGKAAAAEVKKLAASKQVKEELAARKAHDQMLTSLTRFTPTQKKQALLLCQGFVKKYPGAASTKKFEELMKDLGD